jgi:hypothetical protein
MKNMKRQELPTTQEETISLLKQTFGSLKSKIIDPQEKKIRTLGDWLAYCQPGDTYTFNSIERDFIDTLKEEADKIIHQRSASLYVLREGEDKLCCKIWIGKKPPPLPKWMLSKNQKKTSFGNENKPKTGWNEELGWCRLDKDKNDYIPDPTLNKEKET